MLVAALYAASAVYWMVQGGWPYVGFHGFMVVLWAGIWVMAHPKRYWVGRRYPLIGDSHIKTYRFRWRAEKRAHGLWDVEDLEETRGRRRDSEGDSGGASSEPSSPERVNARPSSIGEPGEGTDPELVVPDSSEAIVGYRAWETQYGHLAGYGGNVWPAGRKLEAEHAHHHHEMLYLGYSRPKVCDAPAVGCACGIYAYNKPDTFSGIFGEVSLWGRVLQGEKGWRAQYAYPKRLWVTVPSFTQVQTALDCVEDARDEVKVEMQAKADEVKKQYAEDYYTQRLLADQLREKYGVPVELHDPDEAHPFSLEIAMEKEQAAA